MGGQCSDFVSNCNSYAYTVVVIEWAFMFVMMLYCHFRLGRKDWSLALLVGLMYQSFVLLGYHLQELHTFWF